MSGAAQSDWAVGFRYRDIELKITPERQAEKLACCLIDPARYGGYVDLTHFCNEAILAATKSGLSIKGNVHTTDRITCEKRIALDQPIVMSGEITSVESVPRGQLIKSAFTFTCPDGSIPLRTERSSTRLDPSAPRLEQPRQKPAEPDLSAYTVVGQCAFEPDRVTKYSSEGGNAIHYDPDVAARFGFRAPIAGGLMGVRSLMAALCLDDGPPNILDMAIRFRRPMFWDETLDVMKSNGADGQPSRLALVNSAGKVAIEAEVAAWS
ncbi:MAG: hypothetical protein ACR2PA_15865 [Hyphomicrobiaceae bacterium]